jgi:hypothetical protein
MAESKPIQMLAGGVVPLKQRLNIRWASFARKNGTSAHIEGALERGPLPVSL